MYTAKAANTTPLPCQTEMPSKPASAALRQRLPEAKRTDQTKADSGQTRGQAATRHRPPPLATGRAAHQQKPTIDQHQARHRPTQIATPPTTAGSIPDGTHPTSGTCSAPLPCPTAPTPRRIRPSPSAFPTRQIPPGGRHREAGESLGIRTGSTQRPGFHQRRSSTGSGGGHA